MTTVVDRSSALRTRLFGGGNRIIWSAHDVERAMKKFGMATRSSIAEMTTPRRPTPALVARRFTPPADAKRYDIVASTNSVDRMGDVIEQSGWELGPYRARPVVHYSHDSSLLPVGGSLWVGVVGNKLKATVAFASADKNELAGQVQSSVDEGLLSGISVGFKPLEWNWIDDGFSIRFIRSELLELSWCSIPANSDCGLINVSSGSKSVDTHPKSPRTEHSIAISESLDAGRSRPSTTTFESAGASVLQMKRRLEAIKARSR